MNKMLKIQCWLLCWVMGGCWSIATAAPREAGKADNGAVQKLQAMVKSITAERDAAKADAGKMQTELEQLKKEGEQHQVTIKSAEATMQHLDSELATQKTANTQVQERLEQTNTRLLEVIEKYKALNQSKNEVTNQLTVLTGKHQETEEKLGTCEQHNIKLYESSKDLLDRYENKGTVSALLQDEPLLQFKSVEMETIAQEYEDKIRAGVYKKEAVKQGVE